MGDPEYMLGWINNHDSWGNCFVRELQATIDCHEIQEDEIARFNALGIAPLLDMRDLMRTWTVPVAGRLSYATLAASSVELVRRALAPR